MQNPAQHFKQRKAAADAEVTKLSGTIRSVAIARLVVFTALVPLVIVAAIDHYFWVIGAAVATAIGFSMLIRWHEKLHRKRKYAQAISAINEEELNRLAFQLDGLDNGADFFDAQHPYIGDLDFYGQGSIFQYINRTATLAGRSRLAEWLNNRTENETVLLRQQAIQELTALTDFREDFRANASLQEEPKNAERSIIKWIEEPPQFLQKASTYKILLIGLPLLTFGSIVGMFLGSPSALPIVLFLLQLGITGQLNKKIALQHDKTSLQFKRFRKYGALIGIIEAQEFSAAHNHALHTAFREGSRSASLELAALAQIIKNLDQRFNALAGVLLNGLMLWNLRYIIQLEQWKQSHASQLPHWIEALAEFDALISLSGYSFSNPDFCYPEPTDAFTFQAEAVAHPLLNRDERIANDVAVEQWGKYLLITGSNMAGKSTFLRAVGVNMVLAMAGAPVCAKRLQFAPVQLYTSMRVSDSLQARESTFYAELKRLRQIIEAANNQQIFIILDEILRGTNSADKLTGSRALIEQLIRNNSAGLIATHDLDLAEMESQYPSNLQNVHFDVDIDGDKFAFDYKLKQGVCKTMNATQLMRNMGIEVNAR